MSNSREGDGAWMLSPGWTRSQRREEEAHGVWCGEQPPPARLSWGEFIALPLALRMVATPIFL